MKKDIFIKRMGKVSNIEGGNVEEKNVKGRELNWKYKHGGKE